MSLGKCNFVLSYISILNQQQNTLEQLPANESVFTITRQNYETSLLFLVKETQLYLLPDIFLELEQDKFTMVAPNFSGNILFIDNCGILRILVPLNENCVDINWEFICKNISKSKLLLPTNRHSNDLALRVIRKIHVSNNCCSKTYLAQLVAESYFAVNLDRLCGFVCNNCYMCLRETSGTTQKHCTGL